jgi:hypothetical protein
VFYCSILAQLEPEIWLYVSIILKVSKSEPAEFAHESFPQIMGTVQANTLDG